MSYLRPEHRLTPEVMSKILRDEDAHPDSSALKDGRLFEAETFWRDHYLWLKEQGYLLRPRYDPEWVASWKSDSKKHCLIVEDGQLPQNPVQFLDATRTADGQPVALKIIRTEFHPEEVNLARMFSSELHASHAHNHCFRLYDVLDVPDEDGMVLMVMPLLSDFTDPKFETIGEFVSFVKQIFEGLQFMHSLHVAHNDVKWDNIMMDSSNLYDDPIHPLHKEMKRDYSGTAAKPRSRTERPVRYCFIDFGHAHRYDPEQGPPLVGRIRYGGDQTVPEFKAQHDCDPFPVDVYRVGNVMREFNTGVLSFGETMNKKFRGLEFMEPLLQDMCQDDPKKRPTMDEVVARFAKVTKSLSGWKLRSRMQQEGDPDGLSLFARRWTKQIVRIARRVPSIPKPPPRGN